MGLTATEDILEWQVQSHAPLATLVTNVNTELHEQRKGWKLYGDIRYANSLYHQALVRLRIDQGAS